jgi:cytochrome P450
VRTTARARVWVLSTLSSPERWTDGSVAERAKSIPGLWGSTLAFSGGSHSCIGYKFSLYEYAVLARYCANCDQANANAGQS